MEYVVIDQLMTDGNMIVGKNYEKILDKVLKKIKPTPQEEEEDKKFIQNFIRHIDALTPKEVEIKLAGSTSRGTNLRGDRDFDVFLLFPKTYSTKELATFGLEWGKKAIGKNKWEIAYAEHPYLRAWVEGREIDIVPSYKIKDISERATSVDRSPLHAEYILSHITHQQKDEVRLLKQFLKGIGIYGAEGKIQGFSGYLCELLILAHGSFLKLLDDAASKWKNPVFDLEGTTTEENLRKKFPDAAMIFIDPVDPNRNVAAAVSKTSLSLLIYTARKFLESPSERFFFPPEKKADIRWINKQLKLRDSKIFCIEFNTPKIVEDILWPQLYKFASKISERAKEHSFSVFDTDVKEEKNKCLILVEFEIYQLPRLKKVVGPPLWLKEDVEAFMQKHKVTEPIWFENDRILALGKRKFLKAEELLKDIIKRPGPYGVPPDIEKIIKKEGAIILDTNKIIKKYPKFLYDYLQKRNIP